MRLSIYLTRSSQNKKIVNHCISVELLRSSIHYWVYCLLQMLSRYAGFFKNPIRDSKFVKQDGSQKIRTP